MCVAGQMFTGTLSALNTVNQMTETRRNAKLNSQIAINNAKASANAARNEVQTGIYEARKEKLEGLEQANQVKAKNAAGGFDVSSSTNLYNADDKNLIADANAKTIQNSYNSKAGAYYDKANEYLTQANNIVSSYNNNFFTSALGYTSQVAGDWYKNATTAKEPDKGGINAVFKS